MATGTVRNMPVDSTFYSIPVLRNRIYTSNSTSDCTLLVFGKYGNESFLDIIYKNGGSPYITHFGTAKRITVQNDNSNHLQIIMPDFYDGRLIIGAVGSPVRFSETVVA